MNEASVWIKHLRHPLVLVGFGLFVFAQAINQLLLGNTNISGTGMEHLLWWAMLLLFILAAMAVAGGLALSWKNAAKLPEQAKQHPYDAAAVASVEQTTHEEKSPAINSGKDVRMSYGNAASSPKKAVEKADAAVQEQKAVPMHVKQETKGRKSPTVNAQGDVEINYAE